MAMKRFLTFLLIVVSIVGVSLTAFRCTQAVDGRAVAIPSTSVASLWTLRLASTLRQEVSDHGVARLPLGHDDRGGAMRHEVLGLGT